MKKIWGLLLATILAFGICGCETVESMNASTATEATTEASGEEDSDIEYYTLGDITFPVLSSWTASTEKDDTYYFYPDVMDILQSDDKPAMMMVQKVPLSEKNLSLKLTEEQAQPIFDSLYKGMESGGMTIDTTQRLKDYSEYPGKYLTGSQTIENIKYNFEAYLTLYGTDCYGFYMLVPEGNENTYSDDIDQIVAATTYNNESEDSDDDDDYYDDSDYDSDYYDDSSNDTEYENDDIETEENETVSYQSILDDYTQKLKDATPGLVKEYKSEAASKSGDTKALASLCNDKIGELAKICNDGVKEMARLMNSNGDSYDTYEEWAGKLQDAYSDQASKIQDAYLDSAT